MVNLVEATLLRIYLGEKDHSDGHPTFETIVRRAREAGLAGATVLRGPLGFGHSSQLHSAKILDLSDDLPLVVEIVDHSDKIDAFLPVVDALLRGGLITLEKVRIVQSSARP